MRRARPAPFSETGGLRAYDFGLVVVECNSSRGGRLKAELMRRFGFMVAAVGGALVACGHSNGSNAEACLAAVNEYQTAMLDALVCNTTAPNACGAGRPLIVAEQNSDGSVVATGICESPCLGAVNPDRTATLDRILASFQGLGCSEKACWCPPASWDPATCTTAGTCSGMSPNW